MENDLISRSALLNHLSKKKAEKATKDDMGAGAHLIVAILDLLAELVSLWPAADAVEVVRCRDCKYFIPKVDVGGFCKCGEVNGGIPHIRVNDDFCSYGERRADDGEG